MTTGRLAWLDDELASLAGRHLIRELKRRDGAQDAAFRLGGQEQINFGSNDYLGLAADARLAEAVELSLDACGWGSGASPLVTGRATLHARLEQEIAAFEGTEAALLFPTGFAANAGTISAVVGKADAIFSDAKNHASIIDGCRLSGARVVVYPHGDVAALEKLMNELPDVRRRLIVTDGLFSMDGDLAPLAELADLADKRSAMLMVDEAHATGVFGARGRGVAEQCGVDERVDIRVGTLSKALGSIGGFVAGSRSLIDWLANRARPYVFSTALPEACCAASLVALQVVRDEPNRRQTLLDRASRLRESLRLAGWNVGASASQIVPVFVGDPQQVMRLSAALGERGLFVPGIRPPSVPEGESLLRISLSFAHTDEMIARLLEALGEPAS